MSRTHRVATPVRSIDSGLSEEEKLELQKGASVPFAPEEEMARDAEEAAWANRPEPKRSLTPNDLFFSLKKKGLIVEADLPPDIKVPKSGTR